MDNLKQLIKENLEHLPEDLQKIVTDDGLLGKIQEVAEKNNLNESQGEILKNETYFVLLGIEIVSDLQKNLEEQIGFGTDKSGKIAGEIHDKIFEPVEITLLAFEELNNRMKREEKIKIGREAFEETLKSIEPENLQKDKVVEDIKKDLSDLNWGDVTNFGASEEQKKSENKEDKPEQKTENIYDISEFEKMADEPKKEEVKVTPVESKRYGIEPATDLGMADFDWQGDISGVEIDNDPKNLEESEHNKENLDKNQILSEIENPPAYNKMSSFENKMNKTVIQETEKEEIEDKNIKKIERSKYKGNDPYREPID